MSVSEGWSLAEVRETLSCWTEYKVALETHTLISIARQYSFRRSLYVTLYTRTLVRRVDVTILFHGRPKWGH